MTAPAPLDAPAPELAEFDGLPVTWTPWEPGLDTTLRFHADLSCDRCGVDGYPYPGCWGLVPERLAVAKVGDEPALGQPLRQLAASRCPACGWVHVIALGVPGWSWQWGGPGDPLPVGLEQREPAPARKRGRAPRARTARTVSRTAQETSGAVPASEDTRRAAREQVAAALAAARARRRV